MTRPVDPPRSSKCLAHRQAGGAIGRPIYLILLKRACERAAAKETAKLSILVAEDSDVDTDMPRCLILCDGSCSFQGIYTAERPIEPPRMILAFKVRSRKDLATTRVALAEDVGDAVNLGIEPCLPHALSEPLSCRRCPGQRASGDARQSCKRRRLQGTAGQTARAPA